MAQLKMTKIDYDINVSGGEVLTGSVMLKPCPFCGEKYNLSLANTHTPSCWVECGKCEAQASGQCFWPEKGPKKEHFELAIESAKDRWNQRI